MQSYSPKEYHPISKYSTQIQTHMRLIPLQVFTTVILLCSSVCVAQHTYQFHSHNDYYQNTPFWEAYTHGANSIEADLFLENDALYVAHTEAEIDTNKTLEKLYLNPLLRLAKEEKLRELYLLIDIKTEAVATLNQLIKTLKSYPELRNSPNLKIVISGRRPLPKFYKDYPDYIYFDHQNTKNLQEINLSKVAMLSQSFKEYTVWNGLGRLTAPDLVKVESVIKKAHNHNLKIRFWATPDTKTSWGRLAKMGVDFINTDQPAKASAYLKTLDERSFTVEHPISVYKPKYLYNTKHTPKNIILMVGDGNGLSQISSAMIANRGQLTLTQLHTIGLLKTSAYDDLVTDSAAGGTAMATGQKTNNRAIGTDPEGNTVENLTEILGSKGFLNGIMTTDNISGATPSSFFAHQTERDYSKAIVDDLLKSEIDFFVSAGGKNHSAMQEVYGRKAIDELTNFNKRTAIYLSEHQVKDAHSRGDLFPNHLKKVLKTLNNQDQPYFLVVEASKIDSYGHANTIKGIVQEVLDFDKAIAETLKAVDEDNNTLVVITADHETSGFGILQGHPDSFEIEGDFLSHDHTGVMVPVFAYGPQSHNFRGVYENTEIFHKILEALEIQK